MQAMKGTARTHSLEYNTYECASMGRLLFGAHDGLSTVRSRSREAKNNFSESCLAQPTTVATDSSALVDPLLHGKVMSSHVVATEACAM